MISLMAAVKMRLRINELQSLLQEAHDAFDEGNNTTGQCSRCGAKTYDGDGWKHADGCMMLRMRRALNPARKKEME